MSVSPDSWDDVGGPNTIAVLPHQLAVSATPATHAELRRFLEELKHALGLGPAPHQTKSAAAIERALASELTLKTDGISLTEFRAWLSERFDISVAIHEQAIEEEGISLDTPIAADSSGVELRQVLTAILKPADLTWLVHHDVLFITTAVEEEMVMPRRFYHVDDLLARGRPGAFDETSLLNLIKSIVAPDTWDDVGGPGTVAAIKPGVWLIFQTAPVHHELKQSLARLRAAVQAAEQEWLEAGGEEGRRDATDERDLERAVYRLEGIVAEDAVRAIRDTIAPSSWHKRGGTGTMVVVRRESTTNAQQPADKPAGEPSPKASATLLVVRQTPEVHQEIAGLLAALGVPPPIRAPVVSYGAHGVPVKP